MDDLLTVKQVAILLKVHHLTIRRYINEGKLKAVRISGNVRITLTDLRSFQEAYTPSDKPPRSAVAATQSSQTPFSVNDSLFRLKGRGLSLDR